MDCIMEAKKFIQRAREASHKEVIDQDLEMAEWYLNEELKEREKAQRDGRQDQNEASKPTRAA
jgi:hypothetical protein